MLEPILQEILNVITGVKTYLPDIKIVLGIILGLLLLTYFKGAIGALIASLLATILLAESFFAQGDIYQISMDRAVAGIIIGLFTFLVNLYCFVRTVADWKD